ncbi:thioredoxin [Lactobacillus amylolyticus DSM 11664]|uniref:Thioredoxin n=2 Tax=Lactobacillus amylolyticus TaxID=83683 RepID=D4YSK0_9LACO|nr:thioredoxin [Lactobacillus amylolyticus DSM 11664]KRL18980.1 thioredoxin [Lactobacillus amylolyticus DSM 11664]
MKMEEIKELNQTKLDEITKSGRVVLEFSATWCPDCRFLDPFLPEIEEDFSDSKFYKIDRDGSIDVAKKLNIMGIPSFVVYQDGQEIGRLVNKDRKTKQQVEDFLRSLD